METTASLNAQPVSADGAQKVLPPSEPLHGGRQSLRGSRSGSGCVGDVGYKRVEDLSELVRSQDHLKLVLQAGHGAQVHLDPGGSRETAHRPYDRIRRAGVSPQHEHALPTGMGDGEEDVEWGLRVQAETGPSRGFLRALQLVPRVLGDSHASSSSTIE